MNLRRGLLVFAAGLGAVLCLPGASALAQAKYPTRPVRIIVPLPPGGAIDVFVRGLARSSRPAPAPASWSRTALAPTPSSQPTPARPRAPDGYTFCLLTRSTVSINPEIYRKLSYEPLKDFEPITNGFFGQQIVILNKNVPVKTLAELVEYSKKNPDKLNFASMGLGGDSHLIMEWLKHETGAKSPTCRTRASPRR